MSENSKIQWTDDTWNPWRGCVKVSPGCAHCYAEQSTPVRVARAAGRELWGGTLRDKAKDFDAPVRWNEKPWVCEACGTALDDNAAVLCQSIREPLPHRMQGRKEVCYNQSFHRRRVFSLSLGDWLDPDVPIEWLAQMLDVVRRCPNLDFLLLTKRPELWRERIQKVIDGIEEEVPSSDEVDFLMWLTGWFFDGKPPANIWIGTTVENQEYADKRIPSLLSIPSKVRFLSYEPALGPVDFSSIRRTDRIVYATMNPLTGFGANGKIDWVIVGGESGPNARQFNIEWARQMIAQCTAAGVACFCKQMGAKPVWGQMNTTKGEMQYHPSTYIKDKKGGDISEWPEELRIRRWPKTSPSTARDASAAQT